MVSSKIPYLIQRAKDLYDEGKAVVLAMWSTGGSAISAAGGDDGNENNDDIVSAPRESILKLLRHLNSENDESNWIGDTRWIEDADDRNSSQHTLAEQDRDIHQETLQMLVSEVQQLELPGNALDLLIYGLGGPTEVAELSGRSVRQIRVGTAWSTERRRNNADGNNQERAAFQAGIKKFAVITGAASAGISLHAERSCANQRPRVMLITELTWAADNTMQQFGRIHRSNQTSAPAYELTVSSLGGESRFVGSITARLQSLGALTKGDRGAAVGDVDGASAFASQTFLDKWGNDALKQVCVDLCQKDEPTKLPPCVFSEKTWNLLSPMLSDKLKRMDHRYSLLTLIKEFLQYSMATYQKEAREALRSVQIGDADVSACSGLLHGGRNGKLNAKRFFNRLGGLSIFNQQNVYNHFLMHHAAVVSAAKASGKYENSSAVLNNSFTSIQLDSSVFKEADEVVHTSSDGSETRMVHLICDRGTSWDQAQAKLKNAIVTNKRLIAQEKVIVSMNHVLGQMNGWYGWRPNNLRTEIFLVYGEAEAVKQSRSTRGHDFYTAPRREKIHWESHWLRFKFVLRQGSQSHASIASRSQCDAYSKDLARCSCGRETHLEKTI